MRHIRPSSATDHVPHFSYLQEEGYFNSILSTLRVDAVNLTR